MPRSLSAHFCLLLALPTLLPACAPAPSPPPAAQIQTIPDEPQLPSPTAENPVTARAVLSPSAAPAGQDVELHITARIAPGHFLYAAAEPNSPFAPAAVTLGPSPHLAPIGPWQTTAPDPAGHLTGTVHFTRRLRLADVAPTGPLRVTCAFTFVACNSELCWPARTLPLETILTVTRPARP